MSVLPNITLAINVEEVTSLEALKALGHEWFNLRDNRLRHRMSLYKRVGIPVRSLGIEN